MISVNCINGQYLGNESFEFYPFLFYFVMNSNIVNDLIFNGFYR